MTTQRMRTELDLPLVVTNLMKGVVYRDSHELVWQHLVPLIPRVSDYVATMGLTVVVDESEGYAFLRSKPVDSDDDSPQIPRLIARHALSFHTSCRFSSFMSRRVALNCADGGVLTLCPPRRFSISCSLLLASSSCWPGGSAARIGRCGGCGEVQGLSVSD